MGLALLELQKETCRKFGAEFSASPNEMKIGVSKNVTTGLQPINGFRHPVDEESTGWYVYAGEDNSKESDFFVPLHVAHLQEWCPGCLRYLGLPPGWRFLIADEYEDVWFDPELLV